MIKNDFFAIEKNGTGIGGDEALIEKNGTGIDRAACSLIEKNGTGIRFGRALASMALAAVLAAPAVASDFKGMVNRSGDQLTISITDGNLLLTGSANLRSGYSVVGLNALEVDMRVNSEGNGTGVASEGNGTGKPSSEGNGTGVSSEGNGTGVTSEGNGTGVASEGNGTGVASEGNGTGVSSEGNGTGVSSEGNGTGVARFCLADPRVRSEGNGTGVSSEGNGTGYTKSEGNGTGVSSEGNGTGVTSEGNGTGVASEGNGTGVSSEGNGTGYASTAPIGLVIDLSGGNDGSIQPQGCEFETVTLSWGLAEVAMNGSSASILLYGVRRDGTLVEIDALELPVIHQ